MNKNKKILIIINFASYSRKYFEELSLDLEKNKVNAFFVLDSHLTDVIYCNNDIIKNGFYFSDFIIKNLRNFKTPTANSNWGLFFSDFDRYITMDIQPPLLQSAKLLEYKNLPGLLNQFFNDVLDQITPDSILYESVSNSFALALYLLAKNRKIPFFSINQSRIPGRVEISQTGGLEDNETIAKIYQNMNNLSNVNPSTIEIANEYINNIDSKTPSYMLTNGLEELSILKKYFNLDKIILIWKYFKYKINFPMDMAFAYQHGDPIVISKALFRRSIYRLARYPFIKKYYKNNLKDEDYILYPLHFHPEASTSILAPDYVDEMVVIKAIAFRMPIDLRLYVKEHPSAVSLQSIEFYKALSKMPNVELISPEVPIKGLIRGSQGVITLTSTAGFEAAVLNKPVVAIGNVFYTYFPNVLKINDLNQLNEAIQWIINYQKIDINDIKLALCAYIEFGEEGSFDFKHSIGNENSIKVISQSILNKI